MSRSSDTVLVPMDASIPFTLFQGIPAATEKMLGDAERQSEARGAQVCFGRRALAVGSHPWGVTYGCGNIRSY